MDLVEEFLELGRKVAWPKKTAFILDQYHWFLFPMINEPVMLSIVDENLGQHRNYYVYVEHHSKAIPKKAFTVTTAAT